MTTDLTKVCDMSTQVCFGEYANGAREPIEKLLDIIEENDVEVLMSKCGTCGMIIWGGRCNLTPFTLV